MVFFCKICFEIVLPEFPRVSPSFPEGLRVPPSFPELFWNFPTPEASPRFTWMWRVASVGRSTVGWDRGDRPVRPPTKCGNGRILFQSVFMSIFFQRYCCWILVWGKYIFVFIHGIVIGCSFEVRKQMLWLKRFFENRPTETVFILPAPHRIKVIRDSCPKFFKSCRWPESWRLCPSDPARCEPNPIRRQLVGWASVRRPSHLRRWAGRGRVGESQKYSSQRKQIIRICLCGVGANFFFRIYQFIDMFSFNGIVVGFWFGVNTYSFLFTVLLLDFRLR